MRTAILWALKIADRKTDDELAEAIAEIESGKLKLHTRDARNRKVPIHPIILAVYRYVLEQRANSRRYDRKQEVNPGF